MTSRLFFGTLCGSPVQGARSVLFPNQACLSQRELISGAWHPGAGGRRFSMNFTSKLQKKLALPLLFLFVAALLFCALSAPAHAGDVAGVSTRLYLTVTGDLDGDATFYVSYTDALGPHTKVYYPGVEIAAWTPVTITVAATWRARRASATPAFKRIKNIRHEKISFLFRICGSRVDG